MQRVGRRDQTVYRVMGTDAEAVDNAAIAFMPQYYKGCDELKRLLRSSGDDRQWLMCLDCATNAWAGLVAYNTHPGRGVCAVHFASFHRAYAGTGVEGFLLYKLKKRVKRVGCGVMDVASAHASALRRAGPRPARISDPIAAGDRRVPSVDMELDVVYTPALASELVERRPRLHVYFSTDFCDAVAVKNLGETPGFRTSVLFKARLLKCYVPRDLNLNFQVFVDVLNDGGEWCGNQAGYCCVRWADVNAALRDGRAYSGTHSLVVCADKNFCKGELGVVLRPEALRFSGEMDTGDPRVLYQDALDGSRDAVHRKIISTIDKSYRTFRDIKPSWTAIENIHAYVYQTAVDRILPAAVFDIPLGRPSREEFYLNILAAVLNRYGQSLEWFLSDAPSDQQVGRVVTEMSTVYVNWCKYIPDLVYESRRGNAYTDGNLAAAQRAVRYVESFDCVAARGVEEDVRMMREDPMDASDCEDFARASLEFLFMLRAGKWKSEAMARVQANCRLWYNFAVLGGVSNAKLDAHDLAEMSSMNAHEYVIRIPKALFWAWMRDAGDSALVHLVGDSEKRLGAGLKPLVAEGTGLLYPDETDDPSAALRRQLDTRYKSVMKGLKKRYTFKRGVPGTFYQTCTTAFTPDFLPAGLPYIEFVFVKRGLLGRYTYGVQFTDVSAASNAVRLLPQNPLLRHERQLIKAVLKDLYPTPTLVPPGREAMRRMVESPFVEALVPYAAPETRGARQQYLEEPNVVTAFVRRADATPTKAREIAGMLHAERARILIKPELVTASGVGGYFLIFIFPAS